MATGGAAGSRGGSAAVAAAGAAAAIGLWQAVSRREDTAAQTFSLTLANDGACSRDAISVVDLRTASDLRGLRGLPEELRCPLLFRGAVAWCGGNELVDAWTWARIGRAGPQTTIRYDVSRSPLFTYWDNSSLLASSVLQESARRAGQVADQGFEVRLGRARDFVEATAAVTARQPDDYTTAHEWVRYGGPLRNFSSEMADELARTPPAARGTANAVRHGEEEPSTSPAGPFTLLAPRAGREAAPAVTLFVASAGVRSTAHYDSSANTHVLLKGRKRIELMPPLAADGDPRLLAWPTAHPRARQLRASAGRDPSAAAAPGGDSTESADATASPDDDATARGRLPMPRALRAELEAGDALYIPPGWVHQVTTAERSVALSLWHNGHEFRDFTHFATHERQAMLPFVARLARPLDASRLCAACARFVRGLLELLGLPALPRTLVAMYDESVRRDANLPPPGQWPLGCPPVATADDAEAVDAAAEQIAGRFRTYHAPLRPHYLLGYLENVLGLLTGLIGVKGGVGPRFGAMLDFAQACLVD